MGDSLEFFIRLLPQVEDSLLEERGDYGFEFVATLENLDFIYALNVSRIYQPGKGHRVYIQLLDIGDFNIRITLNYLYSGADVIDGDDNQPPPVCISAHKDGFFSKENEKRATIHHQVSVQVVETGDSSLDLKRERCESHQINSPGRWMSLKLGTECHPPICSGDRISSTVTSSSWHGATSPLIWVPFDCFFHLYSREDTKICLQKRNINWILLSGGEF